MAPVSPIILDVTRTLSRVDGRHATGIDRVERAYIEHLGALDREVMFLSRLGRGIALLDRDGLAEIPIEERDGREVTHVQGKLADGGIGDVQISPDPTPAPLEQPPNVCPRIGAGSRLAS